MSAHYWHEDEFCEALSSYQCEMRDPLLSAAAEVPEVVISELSTLSERLLTSRKFRGYSRDRVHYLANLDVIGAEYKYRNLIDDLTEKHMAAAGAADTEIAKLCRY